MLDFYGIFPNDGFKALIDIVHSLTFQEVIRVRKTSTFVSNYF